MGQQCKYATENMKELGAKVHHIATNKNIVNGYTKKLESIFQKGGMKLSNAENLLPMFEHYSKHKPEYHDYIIDRLTNATANLSGAQYTQALKSELEKIGNDLVDNPHLLDGL